jgi:phosphohistidine phosphatase SixA
MDRKDWSKKDSTRPVNARGRKQSRLLVPMLGAFGVSNLVSSTSARCTGTLEPYAHERRLSIAKFGQLTEEVGGDDPRAVAKLVIKLRSAALARGEPTVICVHRPVLPHILDAMDIPSTTLSTGEFLVAHLTGDGEVHALERHRPHA